MLAGKYVPFGVFPLYDDSSFKDILEMYLKIVIRTPFKSLSVSPFPLSDG